jgi:hypothetical protein
MSAAEINREICVIYDQNMSQGAVVRWCRMLKDGRNHTQHGALTALPLFCHYKETLLRRHKNLFRIAQRKCLLQCNCPRIKTGNSSHIKRAALPLIAEGL